MSHSNTVNASAEGTSRLYSGDPQLDPSKI
jgi:hypothetical protein